MTRVRGCWDAHGSRPYFANLKVMRTVLCALRDEVNGIGGSLLAYVFLDDRLAFLAEGPAAELPAALERCRQSTEEEFRGTDRKPLWGERVEEVVTGLPRDAALAPVARLPVEAGLAADPVDYPWLGGEWFAVEGPEPSPETLSLTGKTASHRVE